MTAAQPDALGVYIFAGGFTLGIAKHFNVRAHFEDGPFGTATVKRNLPHIDIYSDVERWPIDVSEGFHGIPLLYGNPPCAPWSTAGNLVGQKAALANAGITHKWEADPRVECVRRQFALLEKLQPTMWVWESVAAAYSRGRSFIESLAQRANDQGYAVTRVLVNGKWTGLPQERRRFFFVAHKVELPWQHPGAKITTVEEALAPYPDAEVEHPDTKARITGNIVHYISDMQPGSGAIDAFRRWRDVEEQKRRNELMRQLLEENRATNYVDGAMADLDVQIRADRLNKKGHQKGCPNFLCHRLHPKKPSGTIVSGNMLVHPTQDRFLTVKETQILSGYPATYEFVGRDAYAQISKAVLPPVADWLGGILRAGYDAAVPITKADLRDVNFLKAPPTFNEGASEWLK